MKRMLKYMKWKLVSLWWLLTRKNHYLLSYSGRNGKILESHNVNDIPGFIAYVQEKHGYITNDRIIKSLMEITDVCDDILARQKIFDLIETIKEK